MSSTADRLAFLKSVSIFSATPDDLLMAVADLLAECYVKADQNIIEKGEMGDCMYIISEGQVRVHDGERTLGGGSIPNDHTTLTGCLLMKYLTPPLDYSDAERDGDRYDA